MPNPKVPLEPRNYYHIYNRGINSCNIFRENDNYEHFLRLYDKHISPVANRLGIDEKSLSPAGSDNPSNPKPSRF